jgi:4-amino-4-deoxy-L-arabinose transferase-like glycosyltransferase
MNTVTRLLKRYLPALLLFALFSNIVLMCSVPPVSRDALTHHLAVPRLYVQQGYIYDLPDIIHSYNPQLLDLIYCIPLIFGNDIVPKYIHFSFALFTAGLLFLYLKQRLGCFYGWAGAIFFLSIPIIVKLSITVYVDLGLIFFSTASLMCLLKWHGKIFQLRWLILSGIFCGFALSTKYNGIVTCFLLTAFTPFLYLNSPQSSQDKLQKNGCPSKFKKNHFLQIKAIGCGAVFLCIALAVFSPWMIKNYSWTKNPVYPLFDTYFNPGTQPSATNNNSSPSMNHFLIRKHIYNESWFETAIIPLRIFFQGEDDNPEKFDGRLNPLLLILPLFTFILGKRDSKQENFYNKFFLCFSFLYILIVFIHKDMRIRWMGPAIPPLVILSAYGLKNIFNQVITTDGPRSIAKRIPIPLKGMTVLFLIILTAGLNLTYTYQLFKEISPLLYISGKITRPEYIQKFRPEYAVLQFANHHLAKKDKIKHLAFFLGNRRYYSHHDIAFDNGLFKSLVRESKTAKEIFEHLQTRNFTHLIINYSKFNDWISMNFSTVEKIRLQNFFHQHTKKLFSKSDHGLYQLK